MKKFLFILLALFLAVSCKKSSLDDENSQDLFCFTARTAPVRIFMLSDDDAPSINLDYSTDGKHWDTYDLTNGVTLYNVGDKLYIRAGKKGNSSVKGYRFVAEGSNDQKGLVDVSGNILYLHNSKLSNAETMCEEEFSYFFKGMGIVDASKLILPAYTTNGCYKCMFDSCIVLLAAPKLPATTLAEECYYYMFHRCYDLMTAPDLPATTLAEHCYSHMFVYCKSLTTAPELPATTLAEYCYDGMFYSCVSLTTAPELPATTLAHCCYCQMFFDCHSLTTAPSLPATTLAESCYHMMFFNCIHLTSAPMLPATTLVKHCYRYMFEMCFSLQSVEVNFTEWGNETTGNWLFLVAENGTFKCPAGLDVSERSDSRVPQGWTVVTK